MALRRGAAALAAAWCCRADLAQTRPELRGLTAYGPAEDAPDSADVGVKALRPHPVVAATGFSGAVAAEEEAAVHEGHHEEAITDVMKTTSYLLVGFMVTNFVLMWLANWPDPNIRSYTWKMMSSTTSIYLAVLLNNAIRDFFLNMVIGRNNTVWDAVKQEKVEFVIRFLLFCSSLALINVMCYVFRHQAKWLYATQVISGHVCAFAGIGTFALVVDFQDNARFTWIAAAISVVSLAFFRFVTGALRSGLFGEAEGAPGAQKPTYQFLSAFQRPGEGPEIEEWREAVCEAEDDGCSIFMSFIAYRLVMAHVFAERQEELVVDHSMGDLGDLAIAMVAFVAFLVFLTYGRRCMDARFERATKVPTSLYTRTWNSLQIVIAMSMSWLAVEFFLCSSMSLFPGISHEFDEVVSAGILTASGIVGILILDLMADKVEEVAADAPSPELGSAPAPKTADGGLADSLANLPTAEALHHASDLSNVERSIRRIIEAFGLAVGLSWEKAFHAALQTIIKSDATLNRHYVISQGTIAVLNCLLILPVWLKVIVPMAKKTVKQHKAVIDLTASQ